MDDATLSALQQRLRRSEYHIFHFIGHGEFDQALQEGVLLLERANKRGHRVGSQYLGMLLHDHNTLRLAILNACYGALADGLPIDAAVTEARKAIFAGGREIEWATPVLYLRAPDGRIFDVAPAAPAAPTARPDPPAPPAGSRKAAVLE